MRLVELLTSARQINSIPKADIPILLGEIETLKAKLWVRLNQGEEMEVSVSYAPKLGDKMKVNDKHIKPNLQPQPISPQGRLLRLKEVVRMVGLSRSTIYNYVNDGKFPKHRNIGPRSVGWLDTEIHEWIRSRQ
jgi:prophage regulatory protein